MMTLRLWDFVVGRPRIAGENPFYLSSEVGDIGEDIVVVTFDRQVTSTTGDYQAGVTITEDDVEATVGSYQREDSKVKVRYILTEVLGIAGEIAWAYDQVSGTIVAISGGGKLLDVSPRTVKNNIGTFLRFDSGQNSAHLLHFF